MSHLVSWQDASDYVSSGNLVQIHVDDNLTTVVLEIIYGVVSDQDRLETSVQVSCHNCVYTALSRVFHHEPGSGIIYEANLHHQSPLLEDFFASRLQGKAGPLYLQDKKHDFRAQHLEIVGEISVSILCEEIVVQIDSTP